ncbi:hypothetical protein LUZ60_002155 [Juncus effusus]|nr:hypothetical protein LUZ60_002155 [Juncus effusus]
MRLLELVQCGCRAAQLDEAITAPANRPVQEIVQNSTRGSRRTRNRHVGLGHVSPGNWKPSLGDILEDADQSGKKGSRKTAARRFAPSRNEDFRQQEDSSALPAFSPTAYLF